MIKNNSKNIKLNKEICEFIGAFIGDGYLGNYGKRKNQFLIGLAGHVKLDEHYFKNHLIPIIKRHFPFTNPKLRYREDEHTIMLRIYSKELFRFFKNLGFNEGKKSANVVIPDKIIKSDNLIKATIRGIFDTDGCIFFDKRKLYKKPYPRISLQSVSLNLIKQLQEYLSKDFDLYVSKNNIKGYRECIEVYGHKQLERFLKKIGFSNRKHLNKIQNASVA